MSTVDTSHDDRFIDLSSGLVKAARAILNWNQLTLAIASQVSVSTISRFEAGASMNMENRVKVCRALAKAGVTIRLQNGNYVICAEGKVFHHR